MASNPASPILPRPFARLHRMLWIGVLVLLPEGGVRADIFVPGDLLMLQAAPGAIHYSSSPDHAKFSWLVGLEWQSPERWLVGGAYFNNSFDQKCQYYYVGKSWTLDFISDNELFKSLYFKLTGGLLLGYKEPYEDKIPFNNNGVAPGIVPGLGYKYENFSVQLDALGTAGLMFTFGYDFK